MRAQLGFRFSFFVEHAVQKMSHYLLGCLNSTKPTTSTFILFIKLESRKTRGMKLTETENSENTQQKL